MGSASLLILLLVGAPEPQQPLVPGPAPSTANTSANDDLDAPITGIGRLNWIVRQTIGPASLWTGVLSSTWDTAFNHPREYGDSFLGWSKRYGLRLTGVATDNVMEAEIGAFWGEDPRYHPADSKGFRSRLHYAAKMTVLAENRDGDEKFAYARFVGIAGGNALSDLWRPDSQRTAGNTLARVGLGFGGRFLSNLWYEFWPDVKTHMPWNKH
jgi:hypothetical protein